MYLVAVLVVVLLVWAISAVLSGGMAGLSMMLDLWPMLLLLGMGISILAATGLGKDFGNAFRLTMGKRKLAGLTEWKRAKEAVELVGTTLRYGGFFIALAQLISVSWINAELQPGEEQVWWLTLSIAALPVLYGYAVSILLLPIRSRISICILEYMQKPGAGKEIIEGNEKKKRHEE